MTKAVGYVWSPGGSADPAAAELDAQRGRIWAWCKAQGLDLEDIHAEPGGAPQGDALETALQSAAGGALVVDAVPCLAASLVTLSTAARRLYDGGTRLVCLREGIDTGADPWAAALQLLEAAAALAGAPVPTYAPQSRPPAFTFAESTPTAPEAAPGPPAYSEILDDDPRLPDDLSPEWGSLPLESGEGGFVDEGFDPPDDAGLEDHADADLDACPPEMQIALGDLAGTSSDSFPEEDWDHGTDAARESDGAPPSERRPLESVSAVEADVVPGSESFPGVDEVAGSLPGEAMQRVFPMRGPMGAGMPKVRHRRESDYAATAEKASRQVQKGRLDKAAGIWERFLVGADGPVAGRAWNHLGDIHVRAGRPVDAIDAWLRAAKTFEASHYNNMAVATLKKVLKLDPPRAEIQREVADLNARCDKVGDAVEAYLAYARHLKEAGRLAEALEVFARIRILDPVNARHRMQLAEELHAFGFEGEAVREALYAAELLLERGAVSEAEEHLTRWSERVPEAVDLTARLAALGRGPLQTSPAPGAGVEGGVLLTTGGAGRARAEEPPWERDVP